ncbi:valine--tRNA ligase [Candidatus Margulisiibacteriota bacterium]
MNQEFSKVYDSKEVEQKWYQFWEKSGFFSPETSKSKETFTIVIPPPNVTGSLHMGHALDNTLQDILVRYKRMLGVRTLWLPGTDHAGIATQNVVEKALKSEGKKKEDLGREKFLEKVWAWKEEYGGRITTQLRRLGASLDWKRERFTMDEGCSHAVRKEFVSLYKEGLIYRGKRLINWCPRCKTAISDIEVEHNDVKGKLWHLKYPVEGTNEFVTVATTRPETMLGDTAVAVNSQDKRYKHYIGKMLVLPLVNRRIPVIKDDFVDPTFGTGAVKVTPAHDPNDYEMGIRHNLPMIEMLHPDGKVHVDHFPEEEQKEVKSYEGVDRFKVRDKIVADLDKGDFLEKIEDYQTSIGMCYRCKTVVEPYLSDQWFVRMKDLVRPAIQAVEDKKIKFVPDRWTKVYINWMEKHRDWCISRQIWWGHRIPVWYCRSENCNEVIVEEKTPTKCPKCGGVKLEQDPDVLDTWFSSALWPFSTLGWPDKTKELETYYPTSVLVTGYDIITFWVSKMITMGLKFMGKEPFSVVYIHGLVRDISGKKMSKSLGNVIDPIGVIDRVGADALRFALTSLITGQGQDIKVSEQKIIESRNFANKIWNTARFISMAGVSKKIELKDLELADKWILSRLNKTIEKVTNSIEEYDLGEAARTLYDFIWSEFCDWYIEVSKERLSGKDIKAKKTVQSVLTYVITTSLKLLHPFMPFITEEICHKLNLIDAKDTIMVKEWPRSDKKNISKYESSETQMNILIQAIRIIRERRAVLGIPAKEEIDITISAKKKGMQTMLKASDEDIKLLAKVKTIEIITKMNKPSKQHISAMLDKDTLIHIRLASQEHINKLIERYKNQVLKIDEELKQVEARLSNRNFIERAPKEKVVEEKSRADELIRQKEINLSEIKNLQA